MHTKYIPTWNVKKWTEQSVLDQTTDNWEQNSKIVPEGLIRIKSTFVRMMSWCQTGSGPIQ